MNITSVHQYVTSAALDPPYSTPTKSLRELAETTTLTLGFLVAAGPGFQELSHAGYARQPAPGWTISTTRGMLVSTADVEFGISWVDARPTRVMLYSDGIGIAGGVIQPGRSYPADLAGAKIVFPRQALSIRSW